MAKLKVKSQKRFNMKQVIYIKTIRMEFDIKDGEGFVIVPDDFNDYKYLVNNVLSRLHLELVDDSEDKKEEETKEVVEEPKTERVEDKVEEDKGQEKEPDEVKEEEKPKPKKKSKKKKTSKKK